jgi:hypothetical protein
MQEESMFKVLYRCNRTIEPHTNSPLADSRRRYLEHLRPKSSHASAAQIVSDATDATVNHQGPQRIGIKTKIRNNSHHPPERVCEEEGFANFPKKQTF